MMELHVLNTPEHNFTIYIKYVSLCLFFRGKNIVATLAQKLMLGYGCGCRHKPNFPLVGLGTIGGMPSVDTFLRDSNLYLQEKNTENSKRLGQLALPKIELGTSRKPVLSAESLRHWWGN